MDTSSLRASGRDRPLGCYPYRSTFWQSHPHRLSARNRGASIECTTAGMFRYDSDTQGRQRQATPADGAPVSGLQTRTAHARPRQFLARHLLRGTQGAEAPLSQTLLAREPFRERGCERSEKKIKARFFTVLPKTDCFFCKLCTVANNKQ